MNKNAYTSANVALYPQRFKNKDAPFTKFKFPGELWQILNSENGLDKYCQNCCSCEAGKLKYKILADIWNNFLAKKLCKSSKLLVNLAKPFPGVDFKLSNTKFQPFKAFFF